MAHRLSSRSRRPLRAIKVAVPDQTWTDLLTGDTIASLGNGISVLVGRSWGRVLWRVD
jgi:hypothetical protein